MYEMGEREYKAVVKALESRRYFRYGGKEVSAFEREWARKIGTEKAVALTSGTAALICGLAALGIGPGDEVLVPGYTFVSTALAVVAVGAIPVFVDLDSSLTLCPKDLEKKITPRSAALIPVHMQGMPCAMDALLKTARRRGLHVLEDVCQAAGGSYRGKRLGSFGRMGAFSFNQYKVISCGEGGALVTSETALAERAFMLQDGSCSVWPETGALSEAFFCAGNFRFNEVNASILRVQVSRLDGILRRLRANRKLLLQHLRLPRGLAFIESHDESGQCGVCFLLRAEGAEEAARAEKALLKALGKTMALHRPVNSGRHVYGAWDVVKARKGGAHPHWDAFRHPLNRDHLPDYGAALPAADDLLARTVLVHTPYEADREKLLRLAAKMSRALAA